MPRRKSADKLKSRNEILERIWLSTARKLLEQLEKDGAEMSASMFTTITKFLSLNDFDAEALGKLQREREVRKRMEGGNNTATAIPIPPDYEVPSIDPDQMERVRKLGKQFDELDRSAAKSYATIPDKTNQ